MRAAAVSQLRRAAPKFELLRTPLFHKILLAGVAAVFVATAACAVLVLELGNLSSTRILVGALATASIAAAVVVPVYGVVLRIALTPLGILEQTAERVEQGDLAARAELSQLADPRMERLTCVFNRMLDSTVADRERLREVTARAFGAQEAERMRIARELNEETAQTLATLLLRVGMVRRAGDANSRAAMLDELRDDIVELSERIRGVAQGLYPPTLKQLGLAAAVGIYARGMTESAGLQVDVEGEDVRGLLTLEAELALYRIVQDALSNVVRHASAKHTRIRLARHGAEVEATVEDDGVGFQRDEALASNHCIGLLGMRERALYVAGTVEVESEPGQGTCVRARIPVGARPPGTDF